jgi:5-methylcytosine-specific restriction protein A
VITTEPLFVPEQLYHRRQDIHSRYGGQEQGGMITPAQHQLIFLVTGGSGRQHGYEDSWSEDGKTLFYYGEGQLGGMTFTKGNLALRDHVANGEDVHVFEEVSMRSGYLRYRGQMVCTGYEWVDAPDTKRIIRKAIRFELVPIEAFEVSSVAGETDPNGESLTELRRRALADSAECRTPVERRTLYRTRSRAIRLYVLRCAAGRCEGCTAPAPFTTTDGEPYLEPHHIRRLTDGGPDHPRWVVGICPNCHRRAHYSHDSADYNEELAGIALQKEKEDYFLQRQQSVTVEFPRQCPHCFIQLSAAYPLLKTPVTGLIGWILLGQFPPLRPRAQQRF